MGKRPDPGAAIDVRTTDILPGFARVECHPDPDRRTLRPELGRDRQLDGQRRCDGAGRGREDGEEAVSFTAFREHLSAVLADVPGQEFVVAGEGRPHIGLARFPVARRPLDVSEEERDVAGRDGHRGSMAEPSAAEIASPSLQAEAGHPRVLEWWMATHVVVRGQR